MDQCAYCGTTTPQPFQICPNCGKSKSMLTETKMDPMTNQIPTGFVVDRNITYPTFFERFLAYLIDMCVLFIPICVVAWIPILGFLLAMAMNILYFTLLESSELQATFGMRAMKLAVVNEKGERLDTGSAFLHSIMRFVSAIFLCLPFLFALGNQKCETLHDRCAKCIVIKQN